MARGGRRQGVQGRNYGNRTDLSLNARPLPVQTATNQPYGAAGAQADAQRAVPLAPPPVPDVAQGGAGAPAAPVPGSLGAFDRPTDRPYEPPTHGAPTGAGGGLEALGLPSGPKPITQSLLTMAQLSGSPTLMELAKRAMQLGQP